MKDKKTSAEKKNKTRKRFGFPTDARSDKLRKATNEASDLACILVWSHFLDEGLAGLLVDKFADQDEGDELVNGYHTPLGSFSVRIGAAYCMGLISFGAMKNLQTINKIRNATAHPEEHLTFKDPRIIDLCANLHPPPGPMWNTPGMTPRDRFTVVARCLYASLLQIHSNVPQLAALEDHWNVTNPFAQRTHQQQKP